MQAAEFTSQFVISHAHAETMLDNKVHWLRQTGISEVVKIHPREHIRDDVKHSAITDRYIDIQLIGRHKSAKTEKDSIESNTCTVK